MPDSPKKPVMGCAFDLGNTLINDTRLTTESVKDMSRWLFDQSLISSREDFIDTYMRVNRQTEKPFISHTFGEMEFFETAFRRLSINKIPASDALEKYREMLMNRILPDQDIVEAFEFLKQKKIKEYLLLVACNLKL